MAVIEESGESKGWVNGGLATAPEREIEVRVVWKMEKIGRKVRKK
jgi:hypothetical protein